MMLDKVLSERDREKGYDYYIYKDGFTFKAVSDETSDIVIRNHLLVRYFPEQVLKENGIDGYLRGAVNEETAFIPVCFVDRFSGEITKYHDSASIESYDYRYLDYAKNKEDEILKNKVTDKESHEYLEEKESER